MNAEGKNHDRHAHALSDERVDASLTEPSNYTPPPPRKGLRRFLVPAIIALAVLGGISWIVFNRIIFPLIMFSQMKPQATQVGLSSPKATNVADSSDYAAILDSRQSVTLQPRVAGQIAAIYVKAGDRVEAGAPIIQIDAAEQRAQVASRSAGVESAAEDITGAQADVATARDTLKSLQATRAAKQSDVQYNQNEYKRYQDLYAQGASSRQVLDQKLNAIQTAQASLAQTDADIRAQQSIIARSRSTVAKNQRALQQAQANVNEGQAQLTYYRITAPFAGMVGDIPVKVGDFANTATQLLRITQNEQLEVQIQIPLERAASLRQGLPVQLLDDQGRVLQAGKLSFIAPNVDPATQSVQVKAVFNNLGGKLRTEQFARVRVIWDTHPGVLVPTSAISRLGGKDFVFVAAPFSNSGCKEVAQGEGPPVTAKANSNQLVAAQKPVTLGKIIGNDQEVQKGLSANDRIVTSGILNLQNCLPIAEATAPPPP